MRSSSSPPISPLLGIAFGIVVVSTASIAIRYAQDYAPSIVIAAWRLSVASLVLLPFLIGREREGLRRLAGREIALALGSGVFLALHFATWITSLEHTTVANSVVLVSTMPLFVALLAPVTLKEPLTRAVTLGLALALVGGVVIALGDTAEGLGVGAGSALLGDLLAVAGALAGAGYLLIGRRLRRDLSLVAYIGLSYSTAAIVLIVWMVLAGEPAFGYPFKAVGLMVFLGLGPQLLGHTSFNWALRYLPASVVGVTLLGEPVGSSILAYFLLDERPTPLKLSAMALILAGIYIASQPAPARDG
jgi:drug/metabolite transporter (DMT)-like permease